MPRRVTNQSNKAFWVWIHKVFLPNPGAVTIADLSTLFIAIPLFLPRARMCLIVDFREMFEIQMRIDLGGADITVPQQFLDGA